MRAFRLPLAQSVGWQKNGNLDAIYLQHGKLEDPQTTAIVRHFATFQRLVKNWPAEFLPELEQAWNLAWQKLQGAVHPWRVAYGPLQATICYLLQLGWTASLQVWEKHDPEMGFLKGFGLGVSKWELETFWRQELQEAATQRLRQTVNFPTKATPFDWTVSRAFLKHCTGLQKAALLAWHQGSLRTAQNSTHKECPVCRVPLTMRHLIWECDWLASRCRALPRHLADEMGAAEHQELWQRGWVHLPHIPLTGNGRSTLTGMGFWNELDCIDHEPRFVYGLGLSFTCADPRLKQLAVTLVACDRADPGKILGALTAVVPPPATQLRGHLLGLTMLIQHVEGRCTLPVANKQVVRFWKQGLPFAEHTDIVGAITQEWHDQIRVSYVAKKSETGNNAFVLQTLAVRKQAMKLAKHRAKRERMPEVEEELKTLDAHHQVVFEHAVERIGVLLSHKEHFVHSKPDKLASRGHQKRGVTKRQFLEAQLMQPGNKGGHIWTVHHGRYRCLSCHHGLNVGLPWHVIRATVGALCPNRTMATPGVIIWETADQMPMEGVQKVSKPVFFEALVEQSEKFHNHHSWEWSVKKTGLTCQICGQWLSKGFAWSQLHVIVHSECQDRQKLPPKGVKLHTSHDMVAGQGTWKCKICRHEMTWKGDKWHLPSALLKKCIQPGVLQSQISSFFGSQASQSSQAAQDPDCIEVEFF